MSAYMEKRRSYGAGTACPVFLQSGVVLPVSLFILLAATLLTLAMIKANLATLGVGGASEIAAEALANADVKLNTFLSLNPANIDVGEQATREHFKADPRYGNMTSYCNLALAVGDEANGQYDCRYPNFYNLPSPNHARDMPKPRFSGCGKPPRATGRSMSDVETSVYYHQITAPVVNDGFGRAETGGGVGVRQAEIPKCPNE